MMDSESPEQRDEQEEQKWYERTRYQILLFVGGIALFGLVLGLILDWYINPETSTEKKDLVQALGLITAGVAGAVGIFFTWRGQRITREAQEENQKNTQEQLENAQEELRLNREGQITERFTRAIDQLGNESLEIKLGGIYALERIAKESEEDYWPIMEIMTAYVRGNARRNREKESSEQEIHPPKLDIQAVLTVIGRREHYLRHGEPEPLDLQATDLRHSSALREAHLEGAHLMDANLQGAILQEANLQGAELLRANLQRAYLQGAILESAQLFRAILQGADLQGAFLQGANLVRVNLQGTDLQGADLQGAILNGADFQEAKGLTQEQLDKAVGDESTQIPDHLRQPPSWSKKPNDQANGA